MTTLRCENLTAALGGRPVFRDLSATFAAGSLTILAGPNGAGKTTLLRCLARALPPAAGRILLDGEDAAALPRFAFARRVAFLPQAADASSLSGLTVRHVVAAGRLPHVGFFGAPGADDSAAVRRALEAADLSVAADRDAATLSGGETRRLFLAAALAQEADVLLLDEPFEGLDAAHRAAFADLLCGLLEDDRTILLATHDLAPLSGLPHTRLDLPPASPPASSLSSLSAPVPASTASTVSTVSTVSIGFFLAFLLLLYLTFRDCPPGLLWPYRMPRMLCAFFCGGILATAGAVYQTLFRNPLASPYTLGTASGATFGAFLATVLLPTALSVGAAAFAGALLSLALVRACGGNGRSARLLLGGVACAYLFSAGTMLCQLAMTPWESFSMAHWSLGSIVVPAGAWRALLPVGWCGAAAFAALSRPLDAMLAGDDAAASHGLDAPRLRLRLLFAAALPVACAVAVCGPVGFVGLLVPHLGRLFVGAAHRRLLPFCAVGGGLFLALCDAVARALPVPASLPVGVVTSLLGAPTLVFLLARHRGPPAR